MFSTPQGKYIIVNDMPILFLECMNHCDVANGFPKNQVTSAGFFCATILSDGTKDVRCYGESTTLKLKCDEVDCQLVKNFLDRWMEVC